MTENAAENDRVAKTEWSTFLLILACYGVWAFGLFLVSAWSVPMAFVVMVLTLTLHSSLTHEVLHGHPFTAQAVNETLVFLPLGLCVPYNRFRDLHLAHHQDANLTDPYDDPESNYLDPAVWSVLPEWRRRLYAVNNTLLGRIVLGPAIGEARFVADDIAAARGGDRAVALAWGLHGVGVVIVIALVMASPMPLWAYLIAAYAAMGILRIRTFLEHRAHDKARGRTVVIEDRGLLAFLFLNNNLHVVHHMNPRAPWYALPGLYRAGRQRYLACNEGYRYRSYADVFRRYFLRAKDPVPHPLWPQG